ncbi:hypothetical protein ACF0H5_014280 [Mactra antiquata]
MWLRKCRRWTGLSSSKMMQSVMGNGGLWKRWLTLLVLFMICMVFYYMLSNMGMPNHVKFSSSKWLPYTYQDFKDKKWFESNCIGSIELNEFEDLKEIIESWKKSSSKDCRNMYLMFIKLLRITFDEAEVVFSDTFSGQVKKWLNNDDALYDQAKKQLIISAYNVYTREHNMYNPIRGKRPMSIPDVPEKTYIEQLVRKTQPTCDFCNYKSHTAQDVFDRIDNKLSYSASNTFKLDRWHGLFMLKTHHPLNWTKEQFLDLMDTGQQWFKKVYAREGWYKYPSGIWDLLPHAGASQVHPHIHGFLDRDSYQGVTEVWRQAAIEYNQDVPHHNYFIDIIEIHSMLGLTVSYGKAVAFANLVPKRDNEIVIVSEKADEDFFLLWYFVVRGFLDDMECLCYSTGFALPSMTGDTSSSSLPAYVRILTRGAVADVRSDISSLELFTASNANTDPYKVINVMRASVSKRGKTSR